MGMMNSGKMDRKITVRTVSVTQDSHGGQVKAYTDLATVWAEVIPLAGRELMLAAQFMPGVEMKFRIRNLTGFDESAVIVYDGQVFDIGYMREIGRGDGLEILGKRP
jgi:SPP1 family predicted phage head-tail adaptor